MDFKLVKSSEIEAKPRFCTVPDLKQLKQGNY